MVIVRFPDEATHKKALAFLIGQFSGHSWATGQVVVPERALAPMTQVGLTFSFEGFATGERIRLLRTNLTTT
jgi:hypothetical protein